jgi:hypothetical protein
MDFNRLLAASMHVATTIDQALQSPLVAPAGALQKCARQGCSNYFVPHSNQKYCHDVECIWLRGLKAAREKNARKKARLMQSKSA